MIVDLVQRVYHEKLKGNVRPFDEFEQWLQAGLKNPGVNFVAVGQLFFWKIISAEQFDDLISDYETDWMLIHSENLDLIILGKLDYGYSNLLGQRNNPILSSFWLLRCQYVGLQVDDEPIHILTPHRFLTPKQRIEPDMIKLISRLQDKEVEIMKHVDYRLHRTNTIRIR